MIRLVKECNEKETLVLYVFVSNVSLIKKVNASAREYFTLRAMEYLFFFVNCKFLCDSYFYSHTIYEPCISGY